jgi:hypothetical protein
MTYRMCASLALCIGLAACNPQSAVPPAQPHADAGPAQASPSSGNASAPQADWTVVNWGQQTTPAGSTFNVQRDGNSGVSFELNQPAPATELSVTFDGKPLTGVVASGVIVTATIPAEFLATPGAYPVEIQIPALNRKITAGNFTVE